MFNRKHFVKTIFIIHLFSTIPLFPAHKVSKIMQIPYVGLNGIAINKTFSGNYGIVSFTMIGKNEVALLCNVEKKVKIFNTNSKQLANEFSIESIPEDFTYCNNTFFILSDYQIYAYHKDGTKLIEFPINKDFKFIDRIQYIDNSLYIFSSKGNSYKVYENGISIAPDEQGEESIEGWIFNKDISLNIIKVDDFKFVLNVYEKGIKVKEEQFHAEKKLGCIVIIGLINNILYLDVQYIIKDIPLEIERNIMAFSLLDGIIIDEFKLPGYYYLYTKRDIVVHENSIYNLITTEDYVAILNLIYDKNLTKTIYPKEFRKSYHYNYNLPKNKSEYYNKEKKQSIFQNNSISRYEIVRNADAYEKIQWFCLTENTTNHQLIRLPDSAFIRTPEWVVEGFKIKMPYKWGGFTHIDNFKNKVLYGCYAGDDYCNRTDPYSVSYGDAYCVGVDCSGFVSRVWGRTKKEWTGSLPNISTQLPNWISAQKGDIANKAGSHVMLIIEDNPSGTIDIIHANGADWRVSYWTYGLVHLVGYIPRKYNYVINHKIVQDDSAIYLYQNFPNPFGSVTRISFYLPEPLVVNIKVYNVNGQIVETLVNGLKTAGYNTLEWNASKLRSGVYFYCLRTDHFTCIKKCIVLK